MAQRFLKVFCLLLIVPLLFVALNVLLFCLLRMIFGKSLSISCENLHQLRVTFIPWHKGCNMFNYPTSLSQMQTMVLDFLPTKLGHK